MAELNAKELSRNVYREVVGELATRLKAKGFKKQGDNFWLIRADKRAFAGLVFASKTWVESKRVEFTVSMHGALERLHFLNPVRKSDTFLPHYENVQFSRSILDKKGEGWISKEWVVFPSTNSKELVDDVWRRIENEAFPVVELLLADEQLADSVRRYEIRAEFPTYRDKLLTA